MDCGLWSCGAVDYAVRVALYSTTSRLRLSSATVLYRTLLCTVRVYTVQYCVPVFPHLFVHLDTESRRKKD